MGFSRISFASLHVCLAAAVTVPAAGAPAPSPAAPGAILTEDGAALALARLHPDYTKYIHALRVVSAQGARASTDSIYSGLVRTGGREPRMAEDAPESGRGARNDVILFPAVLDPARSAGWRELILDHEYFHARHLARGWSAPLADFGDAAMNKSYYEALAWSYVLERAREGVYASLSAPDFREVAATYKRHHDALRKEILERQPTAWMHYGRFLVDPDTEPDRTVTSPSGQ